MLGTMKIVVKTVSFLVCQLENLLRARCEIIHGFIVHKERVLRD
jgi:hypothetical protein